jgi:hypothetical protein
MDRFLFFGIIIFLMISNELIMAVVYCLTIAFSGSILPANLTVTELMYVNLAFPMVAIIRKVLKIGQSVGGKK